MSLDLIQQKLNKYDCATLVDEENALKEISQEVALYALSRTDFFKHAAFLGGTCLRILYGLNRFSEDLDFALQRPDKKFDWRPYLDAISNEFLGFGYELEVQDRSKVDGSVKKAFLKDDSIIKVLSLNHIRPSRSNKKINIKLEIDTSPPTGSENELRHLTFPLPCNVNVQDLPSLFAGKCHALLCRSYVKGRDWYDFIWYVSRETPLNFLLFENACQQTGKYSGKNTKITMNWFFKEMTTKIESIDWASCVEDVARFLKPRELDTLKLWSENFFLSQLEQLDDYLHTAYK